MISGADHVPTDPTQDTEPVSFETYLESILMMAMSGQLMNAGYAILTLSKKQAIIATLFVSNHLDGKAYEQFALVLESLCVE